MLAKSLRIRALARGLCAGLTCLAHGVGVSSAQTGADLELERAILSTFEQINAVPRCSKDEARISAWLVDWARARGLAVSSDAHRNVLITVPATAGWEDRPGVVLQAHMDMVCAKAEGSAHDFTRDPIPVIRDGDWVRATGTTLGADDGIGIALALTLVERATKPHPKLEVLITADEEKDMSGAAGLDPGLLTGTRYINLDSEDDATVTLGAAGGLHTDIELPLAMTPLAAEMTVFDLKVSGLLGGHSGLDIDKNRPNANILIAELLGAFPFRLTGIEGGGVANAIATSAVAGIAVAAGDVAALERRVADFAADARVRYPAEAGMTLTLTRAANALQPAASAEASANAVRLLAAIPQGVTAWSEEFDGLPESSSNIGIVTSTDRALAIATFQRSFRADHLQALAQRIAAHARAAGATSIQRGSFPAWPPNTGTGLYRAVLASYSKLFGAPMATSVVHAGLECGYIAAKYPAMEIVSIGPTLENVHTSNERLKVSSLPKLWNLLQEVVQAP